MTAIDVTRLPKDPGPAAWNRLLPDPDPPMPLDGKHTADWLVIGAGFAGLAAARRLSLTCPGDRITILDATRIGEGPAGRNSGFMIDRPHDLASQDYSGALDGDIATTEDNRLAIDFAAEMADAFGLSEEAFSRSGKINAAASEKGITHNKHYASHLDRMDETYSFLDADEMRALTGSNYYQGGLFTPGTAIVQPAEFIRGVAAGLKSNRILLHENSPVTRLERNGAWVATTPAGHVKAPRVILAVNGHLNSFGFATDRLMHVFTYASMTRGLTTDEVRRLGGEAVWGVTPADPMGTTVRRISGLGGDRIVIRNRFTFDPEMEVSDQRIARVGDDHDRAFRARFPMLPDVDMQYRWGGRLCVSRNSVQVVEEVDEGLYAACCQNGLGTTRGTLAGMMAADLATGQTSPALSRMTAQAAPKRLPPKPIAQIGAAARLKWGEYRAGREL
ncbi:MAG: FAD-binding oxidoreductase [Pseudomonadota bacterium]